MYRVCHKFHYIGEICKFKKTGNVADQPRSGPRRRATDEDTSATILAAIIRSPICQIYECLILLCIETDSPPCRLTGKHEMQKQAISWFPVTHRKRCRSLIAFNKLLQHQSILLVPLNFRTRLFYLALIFAVLVCASLCFLFSLVIFNAFFLAPRAALLLFLPSSSGLVLHFILESEVIGRFILKVFVTRHRYFILLC